MNLIQLSQTNPPIIRRNVCKQMNKLLLLLSFGFGAVITIPDEYDTIQEGIDAAAIHLGSCRRS